MSTISRSSGGGPVPVPDRSWNTLFETGAQIVDDGFTAEIAIPFKSLRYPGKEEGESHRWGLQIIREVRGRNGEVQVWSPMSREIDPTRPSFVNQSVDPDAGGSVKYGITPNLTVDATLNPDFSQIESDEAQVEVNQGFPLFFSELRPFFIEARKYSGSRFP